MPLQLNWFQVDFTPREVALPARGFADWETTSALLKTEFQDAQPVRWRAPTEVGGQIMVALVTGTDPPRGWAQQTFDLYQIKSVGRRVAQLAVGEYFRAQKAHVHRTRFDVIATRPAAQFPNIGVALSSGVRLRYFSPNNLPGFTANWEVIAEFMRALDDDFLRDVSPGMSIILADAESEDVPESLREYSGRFIGEVIQVLDDGRVEVWTRTQERVILPASCLRLEAKPTVMRQLEQRQGLRDHTRSIFHRIQELKLVIANGRRNLNVFRDQLRAIRTFFARDAADSLIMPVTCWKQVSVGLRLVPAPIEVKAIT